MSTLAVCHLTTFLGLILGVVPEPAAVSDRLDAAIEATWTDRGVTGVTGAQVVDDATFLRRVWLDLAGCVPSVNVVQEFMNDPRSDKRITLVDQLLSSRDFAEHWARSWTIRLTEDRPIRHDVHDGAVLQDYLRDALLQGKTYQRVLEELVTGEGAQDASGPANFILRYGAKPEALAVAVSKNFMGATMQCAQCHDHVFAHWKKEDFRGLAAFFGRLKLMVSEDGSLHAVVESRRGEFQYTDPAAVPGADGMIPMQTAVPRLPVPGAVPLAANTARRQALAAWLTSAENPWIALHAVNSTWQELFGMPLVRSLDEPEVALKSTNRDVLELLAQDFVVSGHDLKRLIRVIVLSHAYQRATGSGGTHEVDDSNAEKNLYDKQQTFAAFPVRPLTVDQLYDSINQATGNRAVEQAKVEDPASDVQDPEDQASADPPVESLGIEAASIQRRLVLLTSPYGQEAVQSGARIATTLNGRRIGRAHVEWFFLATLSRRPTERELSKMLDLVRGEHGARGLEDVLWVLLNSDEFNTNH